jgi:hypothetical protein
MLQRLISRRAARAGQRLCDMGENWRRAADDELEN